MNPDLAYAYGAALLCAAIALLDPVTRWRRRRARAARRAAASTAPSTPSAPSSGCAACPQGEVISYQRGGFEPLEVARINALLGWHWKVTKPGAEPRA